MQIYFKDLTKSLENLSTTSFLIHGGEQAQTMESRKLIKEKLHHLGYNSIESLDFKQGENVWEDLLTSINSLDLFTDKKIIELYLPTSLSKQESQTLKNSLETKPKDIAIILIADNKLSLKELKSSWFTYCLKTGLIIVASQLNNKQFSDWIKSCFLKLNLQASREVIETLAYHYQGNLTDCNQAIQKMALFYNENKKLELEDISLFIMESANFSVFDLVDNILLGDKTKVFYILKMLKEKEEDPILILWAITREVRILIKIAYSLQKGDSLDESCAKYKIWSSKIPKIKACLNRLSIKDLEKILQKSSGVDIIAKKIINESPWDSLILLCCNLLSIFTLKLEEIHL